MNTFVFKIIFNYANKIRIIAPLTKPQVTESRGQGARRQLQAIQHMCNADLDLLGEAILPVLTKCKPGDDIDIEVVKSTLFEQFQAEVEAQRLNAFTDDSYIENTNNNQSLLEGDSQNNELDKGQEEEVIDKQFETLENFY